MSNSATPSYAQAAKGQPVVQSSGSQSSAAESQAPSTTSTQSRDAAPTPSTRAPSVAISTTSNEVEGSQNTRSSSVKPESLNGIDTDSISTGDKGAQKSDVPAQGTEKALGEGSSQSIERRGRGQTLTSQATDVGDGKKTRKGKKGKGAEKDSEQNEEQDKEQSPAPKPELSDAPLPTVNPWAQRAAKFTAASTATQPRYTNGATPGQAPSSQETKPRSAQNEAVDTPAGHGRALSSSAKGPKKDTERPGNSSNQASRRTIPRGARGLNGEGRAGSEALGPVVNNTSSWPTPETAANDLKAQTSADKLEKEKKEESGPSKPRQKEKWVHMPYVPTVAFETPLPTRGGRGGRAGGSRGGRDGAARSNHAPSDSISTERGQDNGAVTGSASTAPSKRQSVDMSSFRDSRKPQVQTSAGRSGEASSANSKVDISKHNSADSVHGTGSLANSVRAGSLNSRADESSKFSQPSKETVVHHQKEPSFQGQGMTNRNERSRGGARGRGGHAVMNGAGHSQSQYSQSSTGYGYQINTPLRQQPNYTYPMSYGGPYPGQATGSHHRSRPSSGNSRSQGGARHQSSRGGSFAQPAMYDPTVYPPGNASYGYSDPQHILHVIASQMNYYFSIDNLCKDTYLRQHMDSQGFVPLAVITSFKRMQSIAQDYQVIRIACEHSPHVQLVVTDTGEDKVRRREKWEPWVLDMHVRHPNARHAGPASWQPYNSQVNYYPHIYAYGSEAPPMFSPAGTDAQFSPYPNGDSVTSPTTNGINVTNDINGVNGINGINGVNGVDGQAHSSESQLSATVPEFSPIGQPEQGPASQQGLVGTDSIGNELANGTSLTNGVQSHGDVQPVGQ